jgi:GTPase SAR1 family protein
VCISSLVPLLDDSAYFINLDPAVSQQEELPYFANIDIRDTIKYKDVMKQYQLGPNGAIVTSLNLFATRFDQVLTYCEKRSQEDNLEYIFMDTPGQIEVFTWSASGAIITEAMAATFPTAILYVVDTLRNLNPITFMSNMMYACSIMFKTKLPFVLVFNKTDVASHQQLLDWMQDIDLFLEALKGLDTYMTSLARSMALVLDEFYRTLKCVGVSAATGDGIEDLLSAVRDTRTHYAAVYQPLMEQKRAARAEAEKKLREERESELRNDVESERRAHGVTVPEHDDEEEEEE